MLLASDSPDVIKVLDLDGKWAEREVDGDITYAQGAVVDAKFFLGDSGCSIV